MVQACGWPVINVEYVSIMAWYLHRNTGLIGHRPKIELAKKHPVVLFTRAPQRLGGHRVSPAGGQLLHAA